MTKLMARRKVYDVVVVGSGPAGAAAARAAALNGAETLLVDKKKDIGVPLRCEGIIADLEKYEQRMNLKFPPRVVFNKVTGIEIWAPSGKGSPILPLNASIVDRRLFDKHIAAEAGRAGADIMIDARVTGLLKKDGFVNGVTVRIGGQTLEIGAKVVIGADGYASNIGRWSGLGQPKRATPMLEYEFVNVKNLDPKTIYVFASREFCPGAHATWAPLGEDSVYLCVLYLPAWLKSKTSVSEMHAKLRNHPAIKDKLAKAVPTSVIAGGGYMASPLPKTVANGVMMVGDAAGQVVAAQVAGIGSSFTCGHLCGEVAAKAARENNPSEARLQEYEETWRGTIGKTIMAHIEANDLFLKIIESDKLTERAVRELGEHFIGLIILSRLHMAACKEWATKVIG